MNCEVELEFALLKARLMGVDYVKSDKWHFHLFGDDIVGELFTKPFDFGKLITIDLRPVEPGGVKGKFKPFLVVQEEVSEDFGTEGSDIEKLMMVFLSFNKNYVNELKKFKEIV